MNPIKTVWRGVQRTIDLVQFCLMPDAVILERAERASDSPKIFYLATGDGCADLPCKLCRLVARKQSSCSPALGKLVVRRLKALEKDLVTNHELFPRRVIPGSFFTRRTSHVQEKRLLALLERVRRP